MLRKLLLLAFFCGVITFAIGIEVAPIFTLIGNQIRVVPPIDTVLSYPAVPLKIAIYGDSRCGHSVHQRIVEQILQFKPKIVVHLGDMVNSGDDIEEWKQFFEITLPLRRRAFFQPLKGNHENPDTFYNEFFGLYNYHATIGDLEMIFLDLEQGIEKATDFLRSLDLSDKKILIFTHYPIFTGGPHSKDYLVQKAALLHNVFRDINVKIVFSAHDHGYQRIERDGITYIVSAGGGASIYPISDVQGTIKTAAAHHFVILEYNGSFKVTVRDVSGKIIDEFEK